MLPKIIYKYRNWDDHNHKKILKDNKVWLSSPHDLNDPFDCQLPLIIDEDEIKSTDFLQFLINQVEDKQMAYDKWEEIKANPCGYFKNRESEFLEMYLSFGVLSLCESPTNFLLWSHYANSHKGFCIGFNAKQIAHDILGTFEKVDYQLNFPVFKFLDESTSSFSKALATKHLEWSYEEEWRITKSYSANTEASISKNSIAEIYFGARMSNNYKDEILSCFKDEISSIEFYEMGLSENSFTVEPIKVEAPKIQF